MSRKNILITVAVVLVGAAVVAANLWYRRSPGMTVTAEASKLAIWKQSFRRPEKFSRNGS
jgi:hypothetical protein